MDGFAVRILGKPITDEPSLIGSPEARKFLPLQLTSHYPLLRAEIDLALTLIRVAEVEAQSPAHTEHTKRAIEKAREALGSVDQLLLTSAVTGEQIDYLEERCRLMERFMARMRPSQPRMITEPYAGPL